MPNGIADFNDVTIFTDAANNPYTQRKATPVPGRWGEAQSIPGFPFANPNGPPAFNLLQSSYTNPVAAIRSTSPTCSPTSRPMAPPRSRVTRPSRQLQLVRPIPAAPPGTNNPPAAADLAIGEVGDSDYYDVAGAACYPVERMRRWVTPADINGTGRVVQWNVTPPTGGTTIGRGAFLGEDNFGPVQYSQLFPAGRFSGHHQRKLHICRRDGDTGRRDVDSGGDLFPDCSGHSPLARYTCLLRWRPQPDRSDRCRRHAHAGCHRVPGLLPDMTNNPFHGFEAYKIPNLFQNPGDQQDRTTVLSPSVACRSTGDPVHDQSRSLDQSTNRPITGYRFHAPHRRCRRNIAQCPGDACNLRLEGQPGRPFGRLERGRRDQSLQPQPAARLPLWTEQPRMAVPAGRYRWVDAHQPVVAARADQFHQYDRRPAPAGGGSSHSTHGKRITSSGPTITPAARSPITPGSPRPRREFFNAEHEPEHARQPVVLGTPTLAHATRRSTSTTGAGLERPNEPEKVADQNRSTIRISFSSETFRPIGGYGRRASPAQSVRHQHRRFPRPGRDNDPLGQPRHRDGARDAVRPRGRTGTRGHADAPIALLEHGDPAHGGRLRFSISTAWSTTPSRSMRRLPIRSPATPRRAPPRPTASSSSWSIRLPAAYNPGYDYQRSATNNYYGNASAVTLGGFNFTPGDPYSGGCWDLVFAMDDPMSRPDPYRGELVTANATYSAVGNPASKINYFGLIPLNRETFTAGGNPALVNDGDVTLQPVNPAATSPNFPLSGTATPTGSADLYVIGNPPSTADLLGTGGGGTASTTESSPPSTTRGPNHDERRHRRRSAARPANAAGLRPAGELAGTPPYIPVVPGNIAGIHYGRRPRQLQPKAARL